MQTKYSIKNKLAQIMNQVKETRKQMCQLYELHRQFTFASIVPKKMIQQFLNGKAKAQKNGGQDKQNNSVLININIQKDNENKLNSKNSSIKPTISAVTKCAKQSFDENGCDIQNKNQEMKDIKANLIQQLSELKSIERKSQALRRTNEKMKQYNSQQKRHYRQSISRSKLDTTLGDSATSGKSTLVNEYENKINTSFLQCSEISVTIPVSIQSKHKTLKCQKGHEFYEGLVNSKDQPNGNGRLQICCSSMPLQMGINNIKDVQFYQGQFKDGRFSGFGTLSYKGGVKYVGEFRQGKRQGKGSLYYNGKAEIAKWQNDVFVSIM